MIVTPGRLMGQMEDPITQAGTSSFGSYQPNGIDTINLQNGSLSVNIPLLSYPQRGTKLHLSFSIKYASVAWEFILTGTVYSNGVTHYNGFWALPGQDSPSETNPTFLGAYVVRDQAISAVTNVLDFPCNGATGINQNPCDPTIPPGGPPPPLPVNLMSIMTSDSGVHTIAEWEPTYGSGSILASTVDGTAFVPVVSQLGYTMFLTKILGPDGITYTPASYTPTTGYIVAFNQSDPDGNTISVSTSGWTDTLGRVIPGSTSGPGTGESAPPTGGDPFPGITASSTQGCTNGATAARVWNVPAQGGQSATYILCYSNVSVSAPSFPNPYINDNEELDSTGGSGSELVLTQVVLPNQTSYTFTYNSDLTLSSITLPTGGMISYTYQTLNWNTGQGVIEDLFHSFTRAIATRTVTNTDGSQHIWTYAFSPLGTLGQANAIITDPVGNQVVHTVVGGQDIVQYYQGSQSTGTLLKTETVTYAAGNTLPFVYPGKDNNYAASLPLGPILSDQITLPNGETSLAQNTFVTGTTPVVCDSVYNDKTPPYYENPFHGQCQGQLLQIQSANEYAYGQGSPGALVKTTTTNYQWQVSAAYASANMIDLPQSVVVTDGSGNTVSSTTYGYDENNGSPQGVYGNLTSTTVTGLNGAYAKTSTVYNTQGMPTTSNDGNGNPTTYAYNDSSAASPTSVCLPPTSNGATHCSSYTWDANTGKMLTFTDQNNVLTKYSYNDSLGRLTEIDADVSTPQEATKQFSYPTPNVTDVAADELTLNDQKLKSSVTVDGFGRQIHSTDATGATVDTTYDSVGNVASVSNPYFSTSDPTYGITSYTYDALSRKVEQSDADGSTEQWCYDGISSFSGQENCVAHIGSASGSWVDFTDENGNHWQRTSDALGRLIEVIEDANVAKLETDYQYDALDDLLRVDQWGGANGSASDRIRTFTYDGLSHLICTSNPENSTAQCPAQTSSYTAGTTGYNYDDNGNVIGKTSPAPNSSSGTITTTYSYDALNRLSSKLSSDTAGTPAACYQYDTPITAASDAAPKGRLTLEWTQKGACPSPTTPQNSIPSGSITSRAILSHDPMGRILSQQTCVYPNCSTTTPEYPLSYDYDLAGDITLYTNGNNSIQITNSYNTGCLSSVTDTWSDATHLGTLFSSPSYGPDCMLTGVAYGTGLTRTRSYDNRLRVTGESDTGDIVQTPTPGATTVQITGSEQSQ